MLIFQSLGITYSKAELNIYWNNIKNQGPYFQNVSGSQPDLKTTKFVSKGCVDKLAWKQVLYPIGKYFWVAFCGKDKQV